MAITRTKKDEILKKLEDVKQGADSIVFVNFKGIPVTDSTAMRAKLRNAGVNYFVTKKTLLNRSFADAFEGTMPELEGEIAIAYSDDAIAPAQHIKEFADKYKDSIGIVGGVFQGVYKDKAQMTEIASIPSLTVLHGMFANFLQQPVQGIALALQAVAESKEKQAA